MLIEKIFVDKNYFKINETELLIINKLKERISKTKSYNNIIISYNKDIISEH